MIDDISLVAFKAIVSFINDLASEYGKRHRPLALYKRLINSTTVTNEEGMKRYLNAFKSFCVANRDAIQEQDASKMVQKRITYHTSDRVFVDMGFIFTISDAETAPIIWRHLLTISAIIDPVGNARKILAQQVDDNKTGEVEAEFLTNIMSKVESSVNEEASNPMDAISGMMRSGVFGELLNGLQGGMASGQLDLGKLLGAVQGMVGNLNQEAGDDPQTQEAMGMLNNMASSLGNPDAETPPDMMEMMSVMMRGMSGMGDMNGTSVVEEEDKEVENS